MRPYLLAALMILRLPVFPQLTGTYLMEYQNGNIPDTGPPDQSTGYQQLNLSGSAGKAEGSLRFEQFMHPQHFREYSRVTQYALRYRDKAFELTMGRFFAQAGRGLLLRGYEIPGQIMEDAGYRVRYGFYRDLEGVRLNVRNRVVRIKMIHGRPLVNGLPPTVNRDLRRPDLISLVTVETGRAPVTVGASYLSDRRKSDRRDYAGLSMDLMLPAGISVIAEAAVETGSRPAEPRPVNPSVSGVYGSVNWMSGAVGFNVEVKDYHGFSLGSGFNDPPPLVREWSYPVLNRSTHRLSPADESGVQAEMILRSISGGLLTLNYSEALNGGPVEFRYRELFAEWSGSVSGRTRFQFFGDAALDDIKGQKNRLSGGLVWEQSWAPDWRSILDVEYQQYKSLYASGRTLQNTYVRIQAVPNSIAAVSMIFETTNDPLWTDLPGSFQIESGTRTWLGWSLDLRWNPHQVRLFYGERRGGPACASGICYEVLDFRGFELRFTSRF